MNDEFFLKSLVILLCIFGRGDKKDPTKFKKKH